MSTSVTARTSPDVRHQAAQAKTGCSIVTIINETLPLVRDGRIWQSRCPFHGERTASFTVYPDPAGHFHCFGCGARGDVLDWLVKARRMTFAEAVAYLGGALDPDRTRTPTPALDPMTPKSNATAHIFRRCWDQGVDPAGTLAEAYLNSRGLYLPDGGAIRFHPRCQRGPRDLPGGPAFAPAMLALMTDALTGEPVGLHRTFLLPDGSGKAPPITRGDRTMPSKSILGSWGSIRFPPPAETRGAIGIAEGIENALSAQQLMQWEWGPVWAAGTQNAIAPFPVLPWAASLAVFADSDDVGVRAARTCESRWRADGRHVDVWIPPAGSDWNDRRPV
jgi:DNA primase